MGQTPLICISLIKKFFFLQIQAPQELYFNDILQNETLQNIMWVMYSHWFYFTCKAMFCSRYLRLFCVSKVSHIHHFLSSAKWVRYICSKWKAFQTKLDSTIYQYSKSILKNTIDFRKYNRSTPDSGLLGFKKEL